MDKQSKILITGSKGMVGSNLVEKMKSLGYTNLVTPNSQDLDLRDRNKVFEYFSLVKPEYVFHLASRVGGIGANIAFPVEFLRDNLMINTNVIDACYEYKIKKLVNLGSSCIYPKDSKQPMKEDYLLTGKLEPTNEGYALSKICSLKLCKYYNERYHTNFISLMPPNMYGEYEKFDEKYSHVLVSLLMKFHHAKVMGDKQVSVWGTGYATREFLYCKDMAEILIFAMQKLEVKDLVDNCFLNSGTQVELTISELSLLIKKVVGFKGEIVFDHSKPDGMMRKLLDSSLLRSKGFTKFTPIEDGLRMTYDWFKKNNA